MDIEELIVDSIKKNGILFEGYTESNDFSEDEKDFINHFHTKEVEMIELNDGSLPNTNLRADHFVVELGATENPIDVDVNPEIDYSTHYALITANHKGRRRLVAVRLVKSIS